MIGSRWTSDDHTDSGARDLRHVYWIGGGSGGGKSTIARRIAAEYGLRLYATDDVMADHGRRSTAADSPLLSAFIGMDMDERWVNRTPQVMYETFHWFRGEGFQLIVDDLRKLEPGVVVEGFRLLPHLVRPLLGEPPRAVWLLPSAGFRRAAFESRGSTWQIARRTSDPERALRNLLERDRIFTDRLRDEVRGLPVIEVDQQTEDELMAQVTEIFGL
jgi:2-phosphoglycerate kinase